MLDFDKILGLNLSKIKPERITIPAEIKKLAKARQTARENKDWEKSDELREDIKKLGYNIEDTATGYVIKKLN